MKKRLLSALLLCALLVTLCVSVVPGAVASAEDLSEDPPKDLPDIDIHSWEFRLCNAYNSVGFYVCDYGPIEGVGLDPRVVPYALAMMDEARAQGYSIYIAHGYLNLELVEYLFDRALRDSDYDPIAAERFFQGFGVNEHQIGLAIDFTDQIMYRATFDFYEDPEIFDSELYAWLLENCADYGFVPRYPEDKEFFYGVSCPHAHFRYVGEEAAHFMMEHQLCLEEFIMLYDPDLVFIPENGRYA